jgi:hypothetical protein
VSCDFSVQKMDADTLTLAHIHHGPHHEDLTNWAELSLAKYRRWDSTGYRPYLNDVMPYTPEDPFGDLRSGVQEDCPECLEQKMPKQKTTIDVPTPKSTKKTSSKHSGKATDAAKPVEKAVEKPAEKVADLPAEQIADLPADKPAEKHVDSVAEKPAEKIAEQPGDKPAEKPADKMVDTPVDKVADVPTDKRAVGKDSKDISHAMW